jgi:hypothetical protein
MSPAVRLTLDERRAARIICYLIQQGMAEGLYPEGAQCRAACVAPVEYAVFRRVIRRPEFAHATIEDIETAAGMVQTELEGIAA